MTPEQHRDRATELIDQAVRDIAFRPTDAELYLKAAEIHARMAAGASGWPQNDDEEPR